MKRQYIVTVDGDWVQGDRKVTSSDVLKQLRQVARNEFEYLAKTSVKPYKEPVPHGPNMAYIDMVAPDHDRMSCSDESPINARYAPDDHGGCYRCTLLAASE